MIRDELRAFILTEIKFDTLVKVDGIHETNKIKIDGVDTEFSIGVSFEQLDVYYYNLFLGETGNDEYADVGRFCHKCNEVPDLVLDKMLNILEYKEKEDIKDVELE